MGGQEELSLAFFGGLNIRSCVLVRYKGGPALPRKLISQGATQKQYSVEVYPLILKLTDAKDNSVSTVKLSKKLQMLRDLKEEGPDTVHRVKK
ncbi:hypothetical protein Ahy_B05g076113 [Arachis hypogaea]|uniref:Uncharacterized protein n=1 Tax=Arachis hypogaea TaxID=3818 RepID=A0A444Z2M5_ARAHY|nr:hypothetical protein Ahy_B05g076113 [Arachis hypogaea]